MGLIVSLQETKPANGPKTCPGERRSDEAPLSFIYHLFAEQRLSYSESCVFSTLAPLFFKNIPSYQSIHAPPVKGQDRSLAEQYA